MVHIHVRWVHSKEDPEDVGGMKEATKRALEWARRMFMENLERDEEQSD